LKDRKENEFEKDRKENEFGLLCFPIPLLWYHQQQVSLDECGSNFLKEQCNRQAYTARARLRVVGLLDTFRVSF